MDFDWLVGFSAMGKEHPLPSGLQVFLYRTVSRGRAQTPIREKKNLSDVSPVYPLIPEKCFEVEVHSHGTDRKFSTFQYFWQL